MMEGLRKYCCIYRLKIRGKERGNWGFRGMAVDLRQVMAAFLTFSMFLMLGNMIKRDHLDPLLEQSEESASGEYKALKHVKPTMVKVGGIDYGPWKENKTPPKRCWEKPSLKRLEKSNGYIFFSLSHSPELHASQIANAVVVARHLGATLALPSIRGSRLGQKRHFTEFYDVDEFISSLRGVVNIDKNPPAGLSNVRLPVVRVPNGVSKNFVVSNIEPIFWNKRNLKIITYFNSSAMTSGKQADKLSNGYRCQAMFESLKLQVELQEMVDSMIGTLRSLSMKTNGRFIAVDLKIEMLGKKSCLEPDPGGKRCYNAEETGEFLKRIGFHNETTIYLTQTGWHSSLNPLRDIFPNTLIKDAIIPIEERVKFMDPDAVEYERLIDYYICTESDVFVAAHPSRFYESVVGKRIGDDNTQIFVPTKNTSASATECISPYEGKRRHSAYSCFC